MKVCNIRRRNASQDSNNTVKESSPQPDFYHAGEIGDLIYGLYTMRALGGGSLLLGPTCADNRVSQPRGLSLMHFRFIKSFLEAQPYITQTGWTQFPPLNVKHDLNKFREFWFQGGELKKRLAELGAKKPYSLCWMHCAAFNIKLNEQEPWLSVPESKSVAPVVMARSARFQNDIFPWKIIMTYYGKESVFVGLKEEHDAFVKQFGDVVYYPTESLLDMAMVINGAETFIGNQSAPMSVALGLGFGNAKRLVQEVNTSRWSEGHDCRFERKNATYCWDGII